MLHKPNNLDSIPKTHVKIKTRINSTKLSSGLYMQTVAHAQIIQGEREKNEPPGKCFTTNLKGCSSNTHGLSFGKSQVFGIKRAPRLQIMEVLGYHAK